MEESTFISQLSSLWEENVLRETELETETNILILKGLQHWKRTPEPNPCCLQQE